MNSLVNVELGLQLDFEESLIKQLTEVALKHYPNEIGGFLLGRYLEGNKKAIISEYFVASNYTNSPTSFEHNVDRNTKDFFIEKFKNEGLHYVGEWHTHPNSNSVYSQTDYKALKKIVNDKKSNIENPILLIIGFSKKGYNDYGFYVIENNKMFRYE